MLSAMGYLRAYPQIVLSLLVSPWLSPHLQQQPLPQVVSSKTSWAPSYPTPSCTPQQSSNTSQISLSRSSHEGLSLRSQHSSIFVCPCLAMKFGLSVGCPLCCEGSAKYLHPSETVLLASSNGLWQVRVWHPLSELLFHWHQCKVRQQESDQNPLAWDWRAPSSHSTRSIPPWSQHIGCLWNWGTFSSATSLIYARWWLGCTCSDVPTSQNQPLYSPHPTYQSSSSPRSSWFPHRICSAWWLECMWSDTHCKTFYDAQHC